MEWMPHWNLQGKHAFLSPSGYSWLGYDEDKMARSYENKQNTARGTALHELASQLIMSKTELAPKKKALNLFVNDCIRDNMSSEVLLYYSDYCFGTADGIKWDSDNNELRIYDLKTGVSKPSFKQLDIYAALFCLEYGVNPKKITIIICSIVIAFTLWQMLNTWINYKIEVRTFENMTQYHKEEIERLQKTIEVLKLLRGEDANATK